MGCNLTFCWATALAMASAGVVTPSHQQTGASGIIVPLTAENYERAKACGRAGEQCAVTPYLLCPSESRRYSVRLATPFSRVALAVFESSKNGTSARGMDRANANRWGTGVYVLPAERSVEAAGIERVEIQREGRTVQPLSSTVGAVTVRMPDGSTKQLKRGYFPFSSDAFIPTADLTLVLTGSEGETRCTIDREQLRLLQ